ncbi:ATP-binding cassette sub-family A member 17-like [Zeugodacus cucurbitae]|uniref:ATP-binding cassette sub-family A member 17-like n=1 Tax=Zeugodacus cucurbitae TaxID=28588 RepID=UPI0010A742A6|nr:ATP-binding cassette sub-family A member 17-like [Zeugodacus cucurbitae]
MISDNSPLSSEHSEEDSLPSNYHWLRFKWMFWKNCCMHWNTRWEFLFAVLMPSICSLIAVILRINIPAQQLTTQTYIDTNIQAAWKHILEEVRDRNAILKENYDSSPHSPYVPQVVMAYAPNLQAINNIMDLTFHNFELNDEFITFETCAELREKMKTEHYFAGVCFNEAVFNVESESIYKIGIYPNRLDYSIIFPSELRLYEEYIGETWDTRYLFPNLGQQERKGAPIHYISEGFIMIQKTISEAYINLTCNDSLKDAIVLRRFPSAERYYDPLSEMLEMRYSLLVSMAYITTILYLLRILVIEQDIGLNDLLATLDVTYFLQFYSWFTFSLISLSIGSVIMILILKIPWNSGFGVFNRSSTTCLFALFTAYNINTLSYCYMISRVIHNRDMAICAAPIFWIVLYLPFSIGIDLFPHYHSYVCLFGNTALALALQHIFQLQYHEGLSWSNFFRSHWSNPHYSVGSYGLLICATSIIQSLIGICAPVIGRTFLKLTAELNPRKKERVRISSENNRYSKTIILEVRANFKPPAVEVLGLTVQTGGKFVLDEVSFRLYEDEITMLMGHNGSGKTTLLKVMAGLKRPTSGKIVIKEGTLTGDIGNARDFVGVCFTDTLLFRNLYVVHQLLLFGRLKGLNSNDVKKETNKYLDALELDKHRYTLTERLTCGQRTKLAVACALIGGSKFVLLDDIVLKLDVRDYKLIWKLLEREKFGRVVVVSTNLSREPELHADNIIMIAQGRLKCAGTAQFLKSMYCFGCHLLISKSETCKSEAITELLSNFIPDIIVACDLILELSYHIESTNVEILESILNALEMDKDKLGIINITIIEARIEELFCKLGAERPAYNDRKRYLRIFNGLSITDDTSDDILFMNTQMGHNLGTVQRFINHWKAMFYKFTLVQKAYIKYLPMFLIMPLFSIILCIIGIVPVVELLPARGSDITDYKDVITVINYPHKSNEEMVAFADTFYKYMYWRNSNVKVIYLKNQLITEYILAKQRQQTYNYLDEKLILGLSIPRQVVGWFNGYLPGVPPLVLNLIHNAFLWRLLNTTNAKINVTLELLPIENDIDIREISNMTFNMGSIMALQLSFIICYLLAASIIHLVSERTSGFEALLRLAGLNGFNFWMSLFFFDLFKSFMVIAGFTILTWLILTSDYITPDVLRSAFYLLLSTSAALTTTNYLLSSFFFKSSYGAYLKVSAFQALGAIFYVLFSRSFKNYIHTIMFIPRLFPLYSFCRGIEDLYDYNLQIQLCKDEDIKFVSMSFEHCQLAPNCCVLPILSVKEDMLYLWAIIGVGALGIVIYEYRDFFKHVIPFDNYDRALEEYKRRHATDSHEVDSVTAEDIQVQSLKPRMRHYYTVICENLGLFRKAEILVDRLSFTIKPGEKFGIIGTNCNYTNALLRLIAGQDTPSFGRVCINSVQMTEERKKALANIGYVPTISCVQPQMTCRQVLRMFCLLYGYPRHQINAIVDDFSNHFGLGSHFHTRLSKCSSGIKERISYSIAILKKPSLMCIGNFSWSVDPHGRRQLYRLIDGLRKRGTAIAITSVMNSYTEILCTKIAVMHEGRFLHIGQPEKIATDLAAGYSISMRMKKTIQTPQGVTSKVYFRLTAFMEKTFPTSKLIQEGTIMKFYIPYQSTKLGTLFKTLRVNSFQLNIDCLTVTRINMNYIFEIIEEESRKSKSA